MQKQTKKSTTDQQATDAAFRVLAARGELPAYTILPGINGDGTQTVHFTGTFADMKHMAAEFLRKKQGG